MSDLPATPGAPPPPTWIDWFDVESVFEDPISDKHIEVFFRSTTPLLKYNSADTVLDIGCGRGGLAAALHPRVAAVHCADTSPRYLDLCRRRFERTPNVFTHSLDPADYTNLSSLPAAHFSIIICLSVIQYYRDVTEVECLIESTRRLAKPGARLLIADIPASPGPLGQLADIAALLRSATREHCLLPMLQRLLKMKRSTYSQTRFTQGLLTLPPATLTAMTNRLNLNAQLLTSPLTLQPNRRHLLIHF